MASPSVTNTFSNGTVIDAGEINTNFTDIINGITDGTKDLSISALTCAGNVNLNANVTLGNAAGDDVTVTGSLASSIPIKTTYSYDIGAATLGLRKLYFGSDDSGAFSTYLEAGTNASSYGLKLPDADGAAKDYIQTDGSGQLSFVGGPGITSKTTTYEATTADKIISVTTGSPWTLTLYAASGNAGRTLRVIKTSSDVNLLTIDGNGSETISGEDTINLKHQYESVDLMCDGTGWFIYNRNLIQDRIRYGGTSGTITAGTEIDFSTELDSTNYTVGTFSNSSGVVTIPRTGIWDISFVVGASGGAFTNVGNWGLSVDGTVPNPNLFGTNGADDRHINGSIRYYLTTSNTVGIESTHNQTADTNLMWLALTFIDYKR